MSKIDNSAAHPCDRDCIDAGLTQREYAALTLRVPSSGDPEIDAMIRRARRWEAAKGFLSGMAANQALDWDMQLFVEIAFAYADALIAEEGKA